MFKLLFIHFVYSFKQKIKQNEQTFISTDLLQFTQG